MKIKPRTWWSALTYEPKIQAVIDSRCTQTIRPKWDKQVGDRIGFHGWEGRPYRSKWSWRAGPWEIIDIDNITVDENGIRFFGEVCISEKRRPSQLNGKQFIFMRLDEIHYWDGSNPIIMSPLTDPIMVSDDPSARLDAIAEKDFIDPPTREALRDVLKSMYGELDDSEMQIITWRFE
jgi:hypothetical protein